MARPPKIRQIIRLTGSHANAEPIDVMAKTVAAISITRTRPSRSASGPANQAPTAQPSSAEETTKPT